MKKIKCKLILLIIFCFIFVSFKVVLAAPIDDAKKHIVEVYGKDYEDPNNGSYRMGQEVGHMLGDDALSEGCKYSGSGSTCCNNSCWKKNSSSCVAKGTAGCKISYCVYDKTGQGTCSGSIEATPCTGTQSCNVIDTNRWASVSITHEHSCKNLYCDIEWSLQQSYIISIGGQKHGRPTYNTTTWEGCNAGKAAGCPHIHGIPNRAGGCEFARATFCAGEDREGISPFTKDYCLAAGTCGYLQQTYTQSHNLKFCFTDADCQECKLPKTIPHYTCDYSSRPYVFNQDKEIYPGRTVPAGTYHICQERLDCGLSTCSVKNDKFFIGSIWDKELKKWFGPYSMQCKSTSTTSTSTTTTTTTKPYHYECNYSNAPIYTESKNNGITHNYYTCDLVKTPGSDTCNKSNDIRIFLGWLQSIIPGIKLPQGGYYNASCLKIVFPPTSTSTTTSSTSTSTTRRSTPSSTTSTTSEPVPEVCRVNDFDITPHLASLLALSDKRSYFIADGGTSNCNSCELGYLPVDANGQPLRDKYGIKKTEYIKSASNLPTSSPDPAYDSDYKYDKDPSNLYVIKNYPQKGGHYLYKLICEGPNNQDESFPVHIFVAPWMIGYEVPPVMPTSKFHTIITSPGGGQSIEEYKGY